MNSTRNALLTIILSLLICNEQCLARTEGLPAQDSVYDLTGLTSVQDYTAATGALKKGDYASVIKLSIQHISKNPADAHAHLLLVLGYLGNNQDDKLQLHLRELSKNLPAVADAVLYQLALYYAKQKRYYYAQKYLDRISGKFQPVDGLKLKGEILVQQGRLDSAIKIYEQLLRVSPKHEETLFTLARMFLIQGEPEKANKYVQRLLTIKPGNSAIEIIHGTAELSLGNIAKAEKIFSEVLQRDKNNAIAWFNLGLIKHIDKEFSTAINAYKNAVSYANSLEARQGLCVVYVSLGDFKMAREQLVEIKKINAVDPLTYLLEADVYLHENRITKANTAYKSAAGIFIDFQTPDFDIRKYIQSKPGKFSNVLALSNILYRQGYYKLAESILERDKTLLQGSVFLQLTLARSQSKMGDKDAAIKTYSIAQKKHTALVGPLLEKADLAYMSNEGDMAITGYVAASKLQTNNASITYRLASLYNALNKPESAIVEYERILKSHGESAQVLNQIAATLEEKLHKPEQALEYATRALQLKPNDLNIKYTIAAIYAELNKHKKARKLFTELSKTEWKDPVFYYRAAKLFFKLNEHKKAALFYEKALNFGINFSGRLVAEDNLKQLSAR